MIKITKQKDTKTQNDTLSRVRAAEKLRRANKRSRGEAEKEAGVASSTYDRSIWLLRYGDPDLIEAVNAGEIGVFTAFDRMHERLGNHYPDQKMLEGAEILCQTPKMALFRKDGELQLAQALSGAREKMYVLTDCPDVVAQIKRIILLVALCGYKISSEGYISKPDGTPFGHLAHHATLECPSPQYRHKTKQKQIPDDWRYNLRISNVYFPDAPWAGNPPVNVYRHNGVMKIYDSRSEKVTKADFDQDMFELLYNNSKRLYQAADDNRLKLWIQGQDYAYLYAIILAARLYEHVPRDIPEVAALMDRLKQDYPNLQIDHLNANPYDCRVSNLMQMTDGQHKRKHALQRRLKKRSDLYADLSRHDNEHVRLEAGRISDGAKTPVKTGIYTVDELLKELQKMIDYAKEE